MAWYEVDLFKNVVDLFRPLTDAFHDYVAGKINVKQMELEIEKAQLTLALESLKVRLAVPWMRYIAFGAGILIGIMLINNCIVLPYFPAIKSIDIPWELWSIFGGSIGIEVTQKAITKK